MWKNNNKPILNSIQIASNMNSNLMNSLKWSNVPRESLFSFQHGGQIEVTSRDLESWYSPHTDEILCQWHSVRISSNGDCTIRGATLPFLAVADSDHGTGDLTNLSDLGATFADDTTDQLVWHGHLVRLIVCSWLLPIRIAGT